VIDLLQRFDLPTRLPKNFPREKIFKALKFDKKFEGGEIRFVVTPKIGAARIATDVTFGDIREAIAAL
jgi:3-dehydroquinate synthetase